MGYKQSQAVPLGAEDVAVCITHGVFGSHLGVAFQTDSGTPKLVHLANHQQLVIEAYPHEKWISSVVPMDPLESIQVLALLRAFTEVHEKQGCGGPEYGINILAGRGSIQLNGTYSPSPGADGFTCSSIIAELFAGAGFELIKLSDWQEHEDNKIWGQAVVCMLRAVRTASAAHIRAVESNISGLRLTPEELAAAAAHPHTERPVSYAIAHMGAVQVLADVLAKCGPPIRLPHDHPIVPCVNLYAKTKRPCAKIARPPLPVHAPGIVIRNTKKVGRNDPCPCNSGKKFKQCCAI